MTFDDAAQASQALADPTLPAAELATIAYKFPQLRANAALHRSAYPGLLDWLDRLGDQAVSIAVAQRRSRDAIPVPAPDEAMYGRTISRITLPSDFDAPKTPTIPAAAAQIMPTISTSAPCQVAPATPATSPQLATPAIIQTDYHAAPPLRVTTSLPTPQPATVPPNWDSPNAPIGAPLLTGPRPMTRHPQTLQAHTTPTGALIGGLLVIASGIFELAFYFYRPINGWIFGVMPGVISHVSSNADPGKLPMASAWVVGIIWVGIGLVILAAAKHNLHIVAACGLIATFVLLLMPACENLLLLLRLASHGLYTWHVWPTLWAFAVPIMIVVATGSIEAFSRLLRPYTDLKVLALTLLIGAAVICLGFSVWNAFMPGGEIIFGLIPRFFIPPIAFTSGWMALVITVDSPPAITHRIWPTDSPQQFGITIRQPVRMARQSRTVQPPAISSSAAWSSQQWPYP